MSGDELQRALGLIHAVQEGSADRVEPFEGGTAYLCDRLPRVWDLNFMRVEAAGPELSARALSREAERLQGGTGLWHRRVTVEDEATARRLLPEFRELGWTVQRHVVMPYRGGGETGADRDSVVEVDPETVRDARPRFLGEARLGADPEAVRQLSDRVLVTAEAIRLRLFAATVDGAVASICELYSDGRTAQIEDVATLSRYRGRGLARAVVTRALEESGRAGHDLTFLVADADDWPQQLYKRLGFEPLALIHYFVTSPARTGGGGEPSTT